MTQSKQTDFESTINIDELDLSDLGLSNDDTITLNLDDTYGATTTYWTGDSVSDITVSGVSDGTFSIDLNDITTDTIDIDWLTGKLNINPSEVERMCQEYPSLEKTWRNFKSVYDMVKQDWEGKKKAGEVDDDIPF